MESKYWRTERAGILITAVLSEVRIGKQVVGYSVGATYKSPKEVDNQSYARTVALERAIRAANAQHLSGKDDTGVIYACTAKIGEQLVVTGSYSSIDHIDHVVELITVGGCPQGFVDHFSKTYLPELEECGWMTDIYAATKTRSTKVEPTKFGDSDMKWPSSLMELLFGGGHLLPGDLMDRIFEARPGIEKPEDCTDCPAVNDCANATIPVLIDVSDCDDTPCVK